MFIKVLNYFYQYPFLQKVLKHGQYGVDSLFKLLGRQLNKQLFLLLNLFNPQGNKTVG